LVEASEGERRGGDLEEASEGERRGGDLVEAGEGERRGGGRFFCFRRGAAAVAN
jgi:hypothetical protein